MGVFDGSPGAGRGVIDEGEVSLRQVAKLFRVSVSFVSRLLQRRLDTGTLVSKSHGG